MVRFRVLLNNSTDELLGPLRGQLCRQHFGSAALVAFGFLIETLSALTLVSLIKTFA